MAKIKVRRPSRLRRTRSLFESLESRLALNIAPIAADDGYSVLENGTLNVAATTSDGTIVPFGAEWSFLDDGSNQGATWASPAFNDSTWDSGPAQLGFGEGDEATVLANGPLGGPRYVTAYFRHTFNITDPAAVTGLSLQLLRDDGAVVYLNGAEAVRDNMPAGPIDYLTFAASSAVENVIYPFSLNPALLVSGQNVLAVEIHQNNISSSDISFDLSLSAPGTILSGGVLANDSDPDGDTLSAQLVDDVDNGTLEFRADGSFSYRPNLGFSGVEQFTYSAFDGQAASDPATVTITVEPLPNTPPTAHGDEYSLDVGGTLDVPGESGVLANDFDGQGDSLTAELSLDAVHGDLELRADGSFTYTPDVGFSGVDQFQYRANDGHVFSFPATVTLRVGDEPGNNPPVANDDDYITPAGQTLVVGPGGGGGGPVLVAAGSTWRYLPGTTDLGLDWRHLGYDDSAWGIGAAELGYGDGDEVTVVDSGPVGMRPATVYFRHQFDIGEIPQFPLTLALKRDDGAVVYLNGVEIAGSNMPDGEITASTLAAAIAADDGRDWQFFNALDAALLGPTNVLAVEIHQVNLTSSDISFDLQLSGPAAGGGNPLATGILNNDFDADGDALTALHVGGPTSGSLALEPDGSFIYTPNPGFSGADAFYYQASDGQSVSFVAIVQILVEGGGPNNDPPIANDDDYVTNAGETLHVSAAATGQNVILPSGAVWKYLADSVDPGDSWSAPSFDDASWQSGAAELGYGDGDEATVIDFHPFGERATTAYFRTTFDVVDTSLIGSLVFELRRDDGAVVYLNGVEVGRSNMPNGPIGHQTLAHSVAFDDGRDWVALGAIDATLLTVGTNTLAVSVHQAHHFSTDISFDMRIAVSTLDGPGLLANDFDVDHDLLSVHLAEGPAHGQLTLEVDGSFTYVPEPGFSGVDVFRYYVSDGQADSNVANVAIHVLALPEPAPLAADDGYAVGEGALEIPAEAGVLGNDVSPEGAALAAELVEDAEHGELTLSSDGSFLYVPDADFHGLDSFTYRASAGTTESNVASVSIAVSPTTVAGRHIFYNNSRHDGRSALAGAADDAAIAPDKTPLLPGGTGTFANYTSYSRGINGVMIDLANLHATPTLADFVLQVGGDVDGESSAPAPAPAALALRPGGGVGGSDRLTIVWPDGAIRNQWLQVTMLATESTGLAANDIFYFGNAVGEAGDAATHALVNATDEILARVNATNILSPASPANRYDYNRDGLVNAADQILARTNQTTIITSLALMRTAPVAAPIVPGAGGLADAALAALAADGGALAALEADELALGGRRARFARR